MLSSWKTEKANLGKQGLNTRMFMASGKIETGLGLLGENKMDYEYAKEKDIKELYDLQLRAFESEAEMINSRNVPALMESYEENRADFINWTVLIKRDDSGKIIGAVRCRENGDHIEIGRVMVAQEHRNRGIATDLMTAVEELTQAKAFELYTCTKSYININLYEKLGYKIYKVEQGPSDLSFAYMRKTLD